MSQDNIQTDTPQKPTDQEFASLEEAVFGSGATEDSENTSDAFTQAEDGGEKTASTNVEQPVEKATNCC
jgi:hypothetical protein